MLPLQCPVNVTLSHATEVSVRAGTTALAVAGNALEGVLQWISNEPPGWMADPAVRAPESDLAVRTTAGTGNALLGLVAVGGIIAVGALQVWRYRQVGLRLAEVRAELAQQPPRPARVQQRRNAVDGPAVLVQPAADARFDQGWRDRAFTIGATQGYLDAGAGRTGQLVEIPDSGQLPDDVRYFRAGYGVGFNAATSYLDTAEDSA